MPHNAILKAIVILIVGFAGPSSAHIDHVFATLLIIGTYLLITSIYPLNKSAGARLLSVDSVLLSVDSVLLSIFHLDNLQHVVIQIFELP